MSGQFVCTVCGNVGKPRVRNRGSSAVEIMLWLFLIIPGFCYTVWRMGRKDRYCRACRAPNPIPVNSPMAERYLQPSIETRPTPRSPHAQGFGQRAG